MIINKELDSFLRASQYVGSDFNLTQGAGGNTSFKSGKFLFIKASGYKLSDALKKNIFVKVNCRDIIDKFNKNISEQISFELKSNQNMKPSIETTMHAIIPHKYVFHLHCLNTLSLVIQKNFEDKLSLIFPNLNYAVVKYRMPGLSLTKEIQKILEKRKPDIFFLSNHGLVVAGNYVDDVLDKINEISNSIKTFSIKKFEHNSNALYEISKNSIYRPIKYNEAHQISFSKFQINVLCSGTLFPDQVVFLGIRILEIQNKNELDKVLSEYKQKIKLPIFIIPNAGIIVPNNISSEAEELLLAISKIISKIPMNTEINYLTKFQENEIINSNDEKYRLKINNSI